MLLAIDPGMNSPGYAVFMLSGGLYPLFGADRVTVPAAWSELEPGHRWLEVAHEIVTRIQDKVAPSSITQVVFEKPQWYQRSKSKGDPNDLVGVAGVAAAVCGILAGRHHLDVFSPTPAEWIGQLPKVCPVCKGKKSTMSLKRKRVKTVCGTCHGSAWETPRGRFIRSRLTPAELALVPDQNDAIDAVGIGLWKLGRLQPRTVFSNGNDGR